MPVKAQKCRNTLCISNFCNADGRKIRRQDVRGDLFSVSLEVVVPAEKIKIFVQLRRKRGKWVSVVYQWDKVCRRSLKFKQRYHTRNSENDFTVIYANDVGQSLTFSYSKDMTGSVWYIKNSMTSTKQAYVNEMPADILVADNIETGSAIVWIDSQTIAFYISGFLDEADLIRMAESVRLESS